MQQLPTAARPENALTCQRARGRHGTQRIVARTLAANGDFVGKSEELGGGVGDDGAQQLRLRTEVH
jgi:hypothetical protein